MNLVTDKWVPVYIGNKTERFSLKEVYTRMAEIRSLVGNGIEKVAILRLLLAITQAALDGPVDDADWEKCRGRITAESLKYLNKWIPKFELYGSFLQMSCIKMKEEVKSTNKLLFTIASGDNHTLFFNGLKNGEADIALGLLVIQLFDCSGLIKTPEFSWAGETVPKLTAADGSLFANILLTVIEKDNLLDTLYYNMSCKTWFAEAKISWGKPFWEYPECKPSEITLDQKSSYLSCLVPMSRGITLTKGAKNMVFVEGYTHPEYPIYRDPMASLRVKVTKKSTEYGYVKCHIDKAMWRELESLTDISTVDNHIRGVWTLRRLMTKNEPFILTVAAMIYGPNLAKKQAALDWSIPVNDLGDLHQKTQAFIKDSEKYNAGIYQATKECLNEKGKGHSYSKNTHAAMLNTARSIYWSSVEIAFMDYCRKGFTDYKKSLKACARKAYDLCCANINRHAVSKGAIVLDNFLQ